MAKRRIATGKTDRAIEVLKAALAPTNNSADIAVDLGTLYTAQNRPEDAIATYDRVLERVRLPEPLHGLAYCPGSITLRVSRSVSASGW